MTRHSRVSCSPTRRAAVATGMPLTRVITNASNSSVKPEPGRAHGTVTRRTPHLEQSMRATRACKKAWCWKKLRWRQVFLTVSCTGQSALPHLGQEKRPPVLKSISISSRFLSASNLASTTIHGGTRPSASWNRSISRMVSPLRPVRRHPAAVLAAVQGQALTGARCRASLTAARDVGAYSVRPGRKDGSAGPNKRMGPRGRTPFSLSSSPIHRSEEAFFLQFLDSAAALGGQTSKLASDHPPLRAKEVNHGTADQRSCSGLRSGYNRRPHQVPRLDWGILGGAVLASQGLH